MVFRAANNFPISEAVVHVVSKRKHDIEKADYNSCSYQNRERNAHISDSSTRKVAIAMPKNFLNLFGAIESIWRRSVTRNEKRQPTDSQTLKVILRKFCGGREGSKL
jgi:hypothetical protein